MLIAGAEQKLVSCIGGHMKAPSDTKIAESSLQRHNLRRLPHSPRQDFCVMIAAELENQAAICKSSQQHAQSSAEDQNARSTSNNSNNTSFVNHGLLLWQQQRTQWVGHKSEMKNKKEKKPVLSPETTYDELLTSSRPFPQRIPLPEMVNLLVDVWEQEGFYDNLF